MTPRETAFSVLPACPKCGPIDDPPVTEVRQVQMDLADIYPNLDLARGTTSPITDVGWRCPRCNWMWGFELAPDHVKATIAAVRPVPSLALPFPNPHSVHTHPCGHGCWCELIGDAACTLCALVDVIAGRFPSLPVTRENALRAMYIVSKGAVGHESL